MSGELRLLGLAHGLLLGLVLASPAIAPDLMRYGVDALFIIGAFQLRLADRRWQRRAGWRGWISHLHVAPLRLVGWAAMATAMLIAGDVGDVLPILLAAALGELILYPLLHPIMHRISRPMALALAMIAVIGFSLSLPGTIAHFALAFITGVTACLLWLRGPDGDPRTLGMTLAGCMVAGSGICLSPTIIPVAWPVLVILATCALCDGSMLRLRPVPWQPGAGHCVMPRLWPVRSRPS